MHHISIMAYLIIAPATPLGSFLNGAAAAEFAQIVISSSAVDAQI